MASDLSDLIQNSLHGTLASLLDKQTNLKQTTKAHPSDLKKQCIKIDSLLKFEHINSSWSFFVPALSATYILNLMMGEDIEPSEELNDETVDALNEVVSNICGGLSTTINSSGFEDLGSVQFSLEGNEIVDGKDYATLENLFRFVISVEDDKEVMFFIAFDEPVMPHIESIIASEVTKVTEIEEDEELLEETLTEENEVIEEIEEVVDLLENETEEIKLEETKTTEKQTNNKESKNNDSDAKNDQEESQEETKKESILKKLNFLKIDEKLSVEEKKQAKLKKIIVLVTALFIIVLITGAILYFTEAFDPEVIEPPKDEKTTKEDVIKKNKEITIKSKPIKKHINFNVSQINAKRLNKKLSLLTKYEILEEDAIEKLKNAEKEKLYQEQQTRLEAFAKNNKEEPIFKKVKSDSKINHTNKYNDNPNIQADDKIKIKQQIVLDYFIQIPTLKIKKFKKFIKKAKTINARLSICKNTNGRTVVFLGPFLSKKSRDNITNELSKKLMKSTKKLDLSKEDFEKMCSF